MLSDRGDRLRDGGARAQIRCDQRHGLAELFLEKALLRPAFQPYPNREGRDSERERGQGAHGRAGGKDDTEGAKAMTAHICAASETDSWGAAPWHTRRRASARRFPPGLSEGVLRKGPRLRALALDAQLSGRQEQSYSHRYRRQRGDEGRRGNLPAHRRNQKSSST